MHEEFLPDPVLRRDEIPGLAAPGEYRGHHPGEGGGGAQPGPGPSLWKRPASGRTDAGVHAREQVVSFRGHTELSCEEILQALRDYLPEDIGATALAEAPPRFHARLSCREKTYLYRVWNSPAPCVFQRRYVCRWPEPLDTAAMEAAGARLCGKHDFAAFCTAAGKKRSTVRTLREIRILRQGEELRLFFTGDGFLYNMVRILAGTLLEVGAGRPGSLEDMPWISWAGPGPEAGRPNPPRPGPVPMAGALWIGERDGGGWTALFLKIPVDSRRETVPEPVSKPCLERRKTLGWADFCFFATLCLIMLAFFHNRWYSIYLLSAVWASITTEHR